MATTGCQRGCLMTWLEEHQVGVSAPQTHPSARQRGLDLSGLDCPDGLLRCAEGHVEASRIAQIPQPCGGPGEKAACACPWDVVYTCGSGCAAEGIEVVATPDAGPQLCRPPQPVARPPLPTDLGAADICNTEGVSCIAQLVRLCTETGRPVRPLGYCIHGCQTGVAVDGFPTSAAPSPSGPGEPKALDGMLSILCRRP